MSPRKASEYSKKLVQEIILLNKEIKELLCNITLHKKQYVHTFRIDNRHDDMLDSSNQIYSIEVMYILHVHTWKYYSCEHVKLVSKRVCFDWVSSHIIARAIINTSENPIYKLV